MVDCDMRSIQLVTYSTRPSPCSQPPQLPSLIPSSHQVVGYMDSMMPFQSILNNIFTKSHVTLILIFTIAWKTYSFVPESSLSKNRSECQTLDRLLGYC